METIVSYNKRLEKPSVCQNRGLASVDRGRQRDPRLAAVDSDRLSLPWEA